MSRRVCAMKRATRVAVLLIAALTAKAQVRVLTGSVQAQSRPLEGATVRIQGSDEWVQTDKEGRFRLRIDSARTPIYVTAGHEGYYNNRVRVNSKESLIITLQPLPATDNISYTWQDPTPSAANRDNCGNCHSRIYAEWKGDAHSGSAIDPLVKTLYLGTDLRGDPNHGPGYKRDWTDEGDCASCHAPIAQLSRHSITSLNDLSGVEKAGVDCEVCHKIQAISTSVAVPTTADVHYLRPTNGVRINFGPFDDSTFPGEVPDFGFSRLFTNSQLCATCHEARSWGVKTYETYSEWKAGPYSREGIECQDCHMRSTTHEVRFADVDKGGFTRTSMRLATHSMLSANSADLMRKAIQMDTAAVATGDGILTVTVKILNSGAGHDYPTGQPMRNLILLVQAQDSSGKPLRLVAGDRVPIWGGTGTSSTDYAGLPGKGFAKVLQTLNEYQKPTLISMADKDIAEFPAPTWRRNKILSDNRLKPREPDVSIFVFVLPQESSGLQVKTRLIYRTAFKQLADAKGWNTPDIVLGDNVITIK